MEELQRDYRIDLIKTIAIFFVISLHFFRLQTPFMETKIEGLSMFIQAFLMKFFQICVPLFCISTGFLNSKKIKYDKKYLKGILKVLSSYVFFCIISLLFRQLYLHEIITIHHAIGMALRFNLIPYGWYIELWIGLYLLTPLINKALDNCNIKEQKIIIFILFLLSSCPDTLNQYGYHLVPASWSGIWPLLYLVIGKYVKENQPLLHINPIYLVIMIIIGTTVEPAINVICENACYIDYFGSQNQNILVVIVSTATFLLCFSVEIKGSVIKRFIKSVSQYSLDIYLCCWMFDVLLYPIFISNYYTDQKSFGPFFFIIVPLCFIASYIVAWAKGKFFKMFNMEKIWR